MAIPHFGFKGIAKSKNQNIIASSSYMARKKMKDQQETDPNKKIKKSFSTTKDHYLTLMMLPSGAPLEYQDPETCWNDLHAIEKDREAVRFLLPLPKELTREQAIELAQEWAYQEFVSKGLVVQLSFHLEKDDNDNFHCHGLGSYRQLIDGKWADVKSHKAYVDENGDILEKVDTPTLKNKRLQFNKDGSVKTHKGWQELVYDKKTGKPLLHEDGTPVLKDIRTPRLNPDGTQATSKNGYKANGKINYKLEWQDRKITNTDLEKRTAAAEARILWQNVQNAYYRKHNILDKDGNVLQVDLRSYAEQDKDKPESEKRVPTQHQGIGPASALIKEENQQIMQGRADDKKKKELEADIAKADKILSDYVEKDIQPENLYVTDYMQPLHEAHNYKNEKCDIAHDIALTGYTAAGEDIRDLQDKETLSDREQAKLDFLRQNQTSWYKVLSKVNTIRNYNGTATMETHCRNQWRGLTGWQRYKYVSRRSKRKGEIYKTYLIRHGQFEEHPEQKLPGKVTLDRALTSVITGYSVPSIKSKFDKTQPVRPQFDNIATDTFATWGSNAKSDLHLPPTVEQLEVLTVLQNVPERIQQITGREKLVPDKAIPYEYTAEQDYQNYLGRVRSIDEAERKAGEERKAEEARQEAERLAEQERIRKEEEARKEAERQAAAAAARIAAERAEKERLAKEAARRVAERTANYQKQLADWTAQKEKLEADYLKTVSDIIAKDVEADVNEQLRYNKQYKNNKEYVENLRSTYDTVTDYEYKKETKSHFWNSYEADKERINKAYQEWYQANENFNKYYTRKPEEPDREAIRQKKEEYYKTLSYSDIVKAARRLDISSYYIRKAHEALDEHLRNKPTDPNDPNAGQNTQRTQQTQKRETPTQVLPPDRKKGKDRGGR